MMRYIIIFLVLVISVSFTSCDDVVEQLLEKPSGSAPVLYTISAGSHESDKSIFTTAMADTVRFRAKFDSSAIYQTTAGNNQGDINKLYGISDCQTMHQQNSARFGWRWYNGRLEIWAYTYNNGVRAYMMIGEAEIDAFNAFEIVFTDTMYIFKLNNIAVNMPRHCSGIVQGYKLFPYFGGDETAPHDVRIWIEEY